MLTIQEKVELNYEHLSPELRKKIDAAFSSPHYNAVLALYVQKTALEQEMINNPFTIRGDDSKFEKTEEGVDKAIKEAVTARQNTETAIKVAKWLQEASDDLDKLQAKLTIEEKKEAEIILSGSAEEIRNKIRDKHGIS